MAIDAPDPDDGTEAEPDIDDLDATDAVDQHLVDLDPADAADQKVQDQADSRAWLKAAMEIIAARHQEPDRNPRVELALDLMMIAAAERVRRILHGDLAPDKG